MAIDTAESLKEITAATRHPVHLQVVLRQGQPQLGQVVSAAWAWTRAWRFSRKSRRKIGVPVLTDVHDKDDIAEVAATVDVLQTPAFLCRQTDFIHAVAASRQAGQHQERPVPVARWR